VRYVFAALRLAAAIAIVIAVVAQWIESQRDPNYFFFNFFGYFTIQSNLMIATVFVVLAVVGLTGRAMPAWLTALHGATVTYMATTGVVYNLLLANGPLGDFNVPWSNDILHKWIPLFAVLQWILFGDRTRIPWKRLWFYLIYPIVWLFVILAIRQQSFVPYPFLDIQKLGGLEVFFYCLGITAFIVGMSAIVIALSRFAILRPGPVQPADDRASVAST
jgi:hypothetical protein